MASDRPPPGFLTLRRIRIFLGLVYMRFIFIHHEVHGPVNLRRLFDGEERFAGSVARLRLLFWLADRGHPVSLVGNVDAGGYRGVSGFSATSGLGGRLRQLLDDRRAVIVTNNPPEDNQWAEIWPLKGPKVRVAVWQGNPFPSRWLDRITSGQVDRIICVSNAHRDYYRLYPGFRNIEVSYSGVDTDLLKAAPAAQRSDRAVVSVSIPRATKGIHRLLAAWSAVRQAVPDATLRICGSAKMHDPHAAVGRTGILDAEIEERFPEFFAAYPDSTQQAGIELMGARPLPEVYRDVKEGAVAVVNCNWRGAHETYCRSAVEAQFVGTPVVGAARGSLPEVVAHGKTGLLVSGDEVALIADAITKLLQDAALRRRMSEEGPKWATPFADYGQIAGDWEAIAARAWSGEPAPSTPKRLPDLLRGIGYGRLRYAAHTIKGYLAGRYTASTSHK